MTISIIAAMDQHRLIGRDSSLPWRLPADLKHFRKMTLGKPVLMGRKTFESIGRPLPKRINLVITHNQDYYADGCVVVHSAGEALAAVSAHEEIMIIGGASIYAQFLPNADRLYLTQIHRSFEGNVYFPAFDSREWRESKRIDCDPDAKNLYPYSFIFLQRGS